MKRLQDRMNEMKPYFRGIEVFNEAIIVKVMFPDNWKVYPSEDGRIKATPSDSDKNITYYYADSNNTTYEEIFDLVEHTITENQNIVLKLKLLKEKVEELKELFQSMPYENLVNLEFVVGKKEKTKRKYTKKSKVNENTILDNNSEEKVCEE